MKHLKYIFLACAGLLMTSCMNGDWDSVDTHYTRGNSAITETHVISIAQLKSNYATQLAQPYGMAEITDDIQIKGYVMANDNGGNVFSQISLQDATGAIVIAISDNGIAGYLPVGTEILVYLKGLYIGNYGYQTQIGTPYSSERNQESVSRMSKIRWYQHFNYTNHTITPTIPLFDQSRITDANYLNENAGRVMTIKNVAFQQAGIKDYANRADVVNNNACERALVGLNENNIVVRTSVYADFAADKLPTGQVDITGLFTRYNNKWQIIIRQVSDVKAAN
ncbi:DUF5689 domain-containing protein [Prevotella sp. HJM029]|uniref:DUF5689 domain-containing protein n=1 Tax=Prevotella sp. HJM029 TaxID=1433844 RepID=UPI00048A5714|nr:DUF5689 domain-containing protein [Prevotella sp. HJM029]